QPDAIPSEIGENFRIHGEPIALGGAITIALPLCSFAFSGLAYSVGGNGTPVSRYVSTIACTAPCSRIRPIVGSRLASTRCALPSVYASSRLVRPISTLLRHH